MKKLISLIAVLAMVLCLAPQSLAEAPVEIVFWHSMGGAGGEAINTMVNSFNEANAGKIKVNVEYQGSYDDAINKIKAAGMSALPCDVVQVYDIGTRFMIDSGWIKPVQEFIDASGFDVSKIESNIAAYYTIDGKLYSMPFNSSTPILYYNKTAFEKAGLDPSSPPKNFDEIIAMAEKLTVKDADGKVTQYGFGMGNYGWFFEQWICKMGKQLVDNNNGRGGEPATKVVFDESGAAKDILATWQKLIKDGIMPYLNQGTADSKTAFIAGQTAMVLDSTAALKALLTNVGDTFEIGTGFFPSINNGDVGGVSIGGGSLWALNSGNEAKQNAVWEFIQYMISPEQQSYWNAQTGYFPITVATHELESFKANLAMYPQFGTAIEQLHASKPEYAGALLSVFPESRQLVQTYTEKLINGELDLDTTIAKLVSDINNAIEQYNLVNQ